MHGRRRQNADANGVNTGEAKPASIRTIKRSRETADQRRVAYVPRPHRARPPSEKKNVANVAKIASMSTRHKNQTRQDLGKLLYRSQIHNAPAIADKVC